jgi:hypothetical protein
MTKSSGLGDQLFISGVDIGADINSIAGLSTPRETLPATNITQSAMARMFGKRDGQAEFTAYFNDDAASTHVTLKALPRTDVHMMYLRGTTLGNGSIGMVGKQVNYDPNRGDDGQFLFGVSALANAYGIDWCRQLTAGKVTHASATNVTSIDTLASAAFGFQAYLQVFSVGSGTATITIEDSANNTDFAAVTNGAFTNVTASTVERIQSSSATATVRRYVRVATSGVFTNLVFAVGINKNEALRAL